MKHATYVAVALTLAVTAAILTLIFSADTAQAQYVNAGCAQDISASTRHEDQAKNEGDAGDAAASFLDYQQSAIYRANCADETTGSARKWNQFFEAEDYFFMSVQAISTETWKSDAPDYHQKAHDLANELMNESLPGTLRGLVQELWTATKDPIAAPPDDTPPIKREFLRAGS